MWRNPFEVRADPWLFPSRTGISVPGNSKGQDRWEAPQRRRGGLWSRAEVEARAGGTCEPPCPDARESRWFFLEVSSVWLASRGQLPRAALHARIPGSLRLRCPRCPRSFANAVLLKMSFLLNPHPRNPQTISTICISTVLWAQIVKRARESTNAYFVRPSLKP